MNDSDGPTSWPRAAQLLLAFSLGAISSATALRLQSSPSRPLEPRLTRSTSRVASDVVDSTLEAAPVSTVTRAPSTPAPATSAAEFVAADTVWVRTTAEVQEMPRGKGKTAPLTVLDVNRATREELMQLPGVGPVLASRIIEERERAPFRRVEDLTRVPGIGAKTLARLRPYVHVGEDE